MSNLVVVLLGGLSGERKISFLTGKACSKVLKKKGYKVINLDAKGYFVEELKKLKPKIVFNALHGKYGEDGFVQSILESLKIPYTHSGVLSSSLAMDKELSRLIFIKNNIKVPKYFLLQKGHEGNLNKKIKTCGSTFKNPENKKAWKLIKDSGCAGMKVGDAQISQKHCNFFVNCGNAKSEDLEKLIYQVKKKVLGKTGTNLELELQIIGEKL